MSNDLIVLDEKLESYLGTMFWMWAEQHPRQYFLPRMTIVFDIDPVYMPSLEKWIEYIAASLGKNRWYKTDIGQFKGVWPFEVVGENQVMFYVDFIEK